MFDRPAERGRSEHDPPEPGVGVNEPTGRGHDQVVLRRSWPDQQHVAWLDRPCRLRQPGSRRRAEKSIDLELPQAITRRHKRRPPDLAERRGDESDAVEPARRIPAMQPKRDSDQALGRRGKRGPAHGERLG